MTRYASLWFGFFFWLIVLGLFIWSLVWVFGDAERRGGLGCLMTALIFLSWPLGLIAWLIWRPQEQPPATPHLPLPLSIVPAENNPITLRVVTNESEAQIIQQLLTGSGIACQIVTLASGFTGIQVAQADKATAEALLEVTPPAPD